jgi:16S rRNA (adenine1518-N6/adenine1519-N6)-dimethyltransferase
MIIGNLPYNISSQILVKMIKFKKWPPNFYDLIFMFQKELGEKIIGLYQTPNYGRISILANSRLKVINNFFVSPNCFRPKPKITSMVIHFKPKSTLLSIKDILNLEEVTKIFFSNKRKMINKNIKKLFTLKQIKSLNQLDLKSRPTELNPEMYYKITKLYEKIK